MEFQDFDLSNKLPYVRSNNIKIVILVSVVILLIGITVFSNLYGKLVNEKDTVKNNTAISTGVTPGTGSVPASEVVVNLKNEAPVIELSNFFNLILQNKRSDAEKIISEYAPGDLFQSFIDEMSGQKEAVKFNFMGVKYSQQQNFAYITVEITGSGTKFYQRFTMIKINSVWKIFSREAI